jgi:hypothetical protein
LPAVSLPVRFGPVVRLPGPGLLIPLSALSTQPHYVPRAEALILASNQQIVLGPQAQVRVL